MPKNPSRICSQVLDACRRSSALTCPSSIPWTKILTSWVEYSRIDARGLHKLHIRLSRPSFIRITSEVSLAHHFSPVHTALFADISGWIRYGTGIPICYVINCYCPFWMASYGFYSDYGFRHLNQFTIGGLFCQASRFCLFRSPQHSWGFKHFN